MLASTGPSPVEQAEKALASHDFAAAEKLLQKAVNDDPQDYVAWFDLGSVHHELKNDDAAIAAYRRSVQLRPEQFESVWNLALLLVSNGKNLEALAPLQSAVKLSAARPKAVQAQVWFLYGKASSGNAADALRYFERAAELDPKNPEPHLAAAELFEQQKQFQRAKIEYQKAKEIDPGSPAASLGLAGVEAVTGAPEESEKYLRETIARNPKDSKAHAALGRLLATEGKKDQASAELQTAYEIDPSDSSTARDLASVYSDTQRYDKAADIYSQLIRKDDSNANLHYSYAKSLLRLRRFAEAQAEMLKVVNFRPSDPATYSDLAVAAAENNNYPLAIKALDTRAQYAPETAGTYFLRATSFDHLKNEPMAIENYNKFLSIAHGNYPDQIWQARHRLIALQGKQK